MDLESARKKQWDAHHNVVEMHKAVELEKKRKKILKKAARYSFLKTDVGYKLANTNSTEVGHTDDMSTNEKDLDDIKKVRAKQQDLYSKNLSKGDEMILFHE